jgi:drug/metabolite transporter (DMT)-like permease
VFYGATFLDESLTVATFGGLVLILVGSWLAADGRLSRRVRADARAEAATSP